MNCPTFMKDEIGKLIELSLLAAAAGDLATPAADRKSTGSDD
jgi:hypothetical protein